MRSIVLVFIGCVPLAVLTVRSFIELGSAEEPLSDVSQATAPAASTDEQVVEAAQRVLSGTRNRLATEEPYVGLLAGLELFHDNADFDPAEASQESCLEPVRKDWQQLLAARRLLGELLDVKPGTSSADSTDSEEEVRRLETMLAECGELSFGGISEIRALLDHRMAALKGIAALKEATQRAETQVHALPLLAHARDAFSRQQHAQCVADCEQLLADYSQAFDASELAKVKLLADRARFWDRAGRIVAIGRTPATLGRRRAELESFLTDYAHREARTSSESRLLDRFARELNDTGGEPR